MSNGWKVGIGYLPQDVASDAKYLMTEIVDENTQYRMMRLVEQAFAVGYESGFTRCFVERSWVEFKTKERGEVSTVSAEGQERSDSKVVAYPPSASPSAASKEENRD